MPFAVTWVGLEIVKLSKVSLTEKDKYHMILLIGGIEKKIETNALIYKTETDTKNKLMVMKEEGRGGVI